jgi:hypothetical protein
LISSLGGTSEKPIAFALSNLRELKNIYRRQLNDGRTSNEWKGNKGEREIEGRKKEGEERRGEGRRG